MGRSTRAASCAAATDFSRPMVIGAMMPGKSTVLRIGIIASAPSGSGFSVASGCLG
jgi:hypothetical protein